MEIKLNDDIINHKLWQEPEKLKWWIDLLFLEVFQKKFFIKENKLVTLEKGQFEASVSFLSSRWGKSPHTIIKFLQMLEMDGLIKREVIGRNTSVVTICHIYNDDKNNAKDNQDNTANEIACIEEIKKDTEYLNVIAMQLRIGRNDVVKYLNDFAYQQITENKNHLSLSDAKRHFRNWIKIKINDGNKTDNSKRRSTETTATSANDYSPTF